METIKIPLTEEEKKRNREELAAMLLGRVAESKLELIEDQNNPVIREFYASLREMKKKKDAAKSI